MTTNGVENFGPTVEEDKRCDSPQNGEELQNPFPGPIPENRENCPQRAVKLLWNTIFVIFPSGDFNASYLDKSFYFAILAP